MKRRGLSAFRNHCRRGVLIGIAAALMLGGRPVKADDGAAAGGAMRIYRDPVTGAIGGPPPGVVPGAALPKASANARVATTDVLTPEPVRVPAGGVKLNLRGRFQPAVRRQAAPDGEVRQQCVGANGAAHE